MFKKRNIKTTGLYFVFAVTQHHIWTLKKQEELFVLALLFEKGLIQIVFIN